MRLKSISTACLMLALLAPAAWAAEVSPAVVSAMADAGRPSTDTARDADRKPGEILSFAGVKPGDTVLELIPGGGYFTRLLSKTVGPNGTVLAASPPIQKMGAAAQAIAADPHYANVKAVTFNAETLAPTPAVDVIFTAQNYHDLHLTQAHQDLAVLDKLFFGKLKKGGVMVVVDHAALPGAAVTETADKLHRIDPAVVKREMLAAGFVFDGQSDVLRNAADPHTAIVFDPTIRGRTDQFVFRFRKP